MDTLHSIPDLAQSPGRCSTACPAWPKWRIPVGSSPISVERQPSVLGLAGSGRQHTMSSPREIPGGSSCDGVPRAKGSGPTSRFEATECFAPPAAATACARATVCAHVVLRSKGVSRRRQYSRAFRWCQGLPCPQKWSMCHRRPLPANTSCEGCCEGHLPHQL